MLPGFLLEDAFNSALDRLFALNALNTPSNVSSKEVLKLFIFATNESGLLFNGSYYDHMDTADKESSFETILTSVFMTKIEEQRLLNICNRVNTTFYWKTYIDDSYTFIVTINQTNKILYMS